MSFFKNSFIIAFLTFSIVESYGNDNRKRNYQHPHYNQQPQNYPGYGQQNNVHPYQYYTVEQQRDRQQKYHRQHYDHVNTAPQRAAPVHYQHHQTQQCDVPSDFWCDTREIAERCNVVSQCESIRRERRPLRFTLFYEALCPFCQRFIANNLGLLYNQFKDQVELELVPWGNSILLRNGQINCNHGPKECDANRLMSCVIDAVPINQQVPFIICFERTLQSRTGVEEAMQNCAGFIRNNYQDIKKCYTGDKGIQLQRQAAYRTMNAKSNPIVEVPYIMINNYSPKTDSNAINIVAVSHLIQKWLNQRRR